MGIRERIRVKRPPRRHEVSVPDWQLDETLWVHALTVLERVEFEDWCHEHRDEREADKNMLVMLKLVILSTRDSEGKPVFEREDLDWLKGEDSRALLRLFEVSAELNGLRKEDQDELAGTHLKNGQVSATPIA